MAGFTRDVKAALREAGWFSPITKISFPVDADIKSRHTANAIMKQAGISKKF